MTAIDFDLGIAGVALAVSEVHGDARGGFVETYRREWFPGAGEMVQANRADRLAGVVVGLHHHLHQTDVWSVWRGRARVVLHDLRAGSPTEGATVHVDLGSDDGPDPRSLLIPPGVGHGFAARTDVTLGYLVDRTYDPADELGVAWDDPAVGADWGVADPVVSDRDAALPRRSDLPAAERPRWGG